MWVSLQSFLLCMVTRAPCGAMEGLPRRVRSENRACLLAGRLPRQSSITKTADPSSELLDVGGIRTTEVRSFIRGFKFCFSFFFFVYEIIENLLLLLLLQLVKITKFGSITHFEIMSSSPFVVKWGILATGNIAESMSTPHYPAITSYTQQLTQPRIHKGPPHQPRRPRHTRCAPRARRSCLFFVGFARPGFHKQLRWPIQCKSVWLVR